MKTVKTKPEFENLAEDEIMKALDEFEDLIEETYGDDYDNADEDELPLVEPENPIVIEVSRLISEYSSKFDSHFEGLGQDDPFPEEIFNFEPQMEIEKIAYGIFLDAVHDIMQEEDDDE